MKFGDWLQNEMDSRDMSQADLSRSSGLTTAGVAYLVNGKRNPGQDACIKIAHALRLPPETVFQAAGILPARKDVDPWVEEQKFIISQLTGTRRNIAERLLQGLLDEERAAKYETNPRPANAAKNI